jgi:hypothetical protein
MIYSGSVRVLLTLKAPVTAGAASPLYKKLV